jgi:hypothetical protein
MSLPSAHTQVDMAIIQSGVAYTVAKDHAYRGADPGIAAHHGALVGQVTLTYWLFVFLPSLFWTFSGLIIASPIFWLWDLGLVVGAWVLYLIMSDWRTRVIGTKGPWVLHGALWAALWTTWLVGLVPLAIIVSVTR